MGNIPLDWYEDYPHLGYDLGGQRITKPLKRDEVSLAPSSGGHLLLYLWCQLEEYLASMEDPTYWRTVRDKLTGREVLLTDKQMSLVQRLQSSHFPESHYDQYEVRPSCQKAGLTSLPLLSSHMLISSVERRWSIL